MSSESHLERIGSNVMSERGFFTSLDDKVEPAHAAVLCIDMQKEFIYENTYNHARGWDLEASKQMAPHLLRFLDAARSFGVPVIHVRANYDPIHKNEPMRERDARLALLPCCVTGTMGFEFYPGFGPREGELLITKHRYDAFFGTELDIILQGMGIKTLILSGVATNGCADSTARSGYFRGYYIVVLSDGTATGKASWQEATLEAMEALFGEVRKMADVEAAWARIRAQTALPSLA
jgi:ureidoacrylate peracid hydrolase